MTYAKILKQAADRLGEAGVTEAELDARYLLEHVFGIDRAELILRMNDETDPDERTDVYLALVDERAGGRPLQYITGKAFFMGLELQVDESVLVPRQDTEVLCELAIEKLRAMDSPRLLDMCTGSGCIVISLAHFCRLSLAQGTDISRKALEIAKVNAEKLVPGKVSFLHSDIFENVSGTYDMIVSNPPYIPSAQIETLMREVKDWEPPGALDGGEDGLSFYRRIIQRAPEHLRENGWLMMEIGYDQADAVSGILESRGYRDISVKKDYAGNDRVVSAMRPAM